jgi:uncharacterized protein (TIGR02246 family)
MISRLHVASPALVFLLLGTSADEARSQAGRKGVENAVRRMINAANRVNIDGVLAEMSANAEMLDGGGRFASMAAVRAAYAPVFKGLRKQDIKVERSNIQMITPTLAVYTANGTFTTTDTTGTTTPRRHFAWTIVWRGDSTNWKATSVHQSLSAPPAAVTQAGRASDQSSAFRDQAKAYENAINKRDAAAVAALFTENADQILVDGPRLQGRNAIRDAADKELKTWPKGRQFKLQVTGSRMLAPDIGVVETAATFSEGPVRSNRGTAVVVREGGRWLISSLRVYPSVAAPARR